MKTLMKCIAVLGVIMVVILTFGPSVWAAPAQQEEATPTPQAPHDPGRGQGMAIMKAEADKSTVKPGENVRFTLQINSVGTRQLDGPRVICQGPAGLRFTNVTSTRGKIIDFYENYMDVDVVNLQYGDSVTITAVALVKPDVPEGTAIVTHCKVHSAYVGTQEAVIGFTVGTEKPKVALPQTGGGMALVLLGLAFAVGLVVIRQFRYRQPGTPS